MFWGFGGVFFFRSTDVLRRTSLYTTEQRRLPTELHQDEEILDPSRDAGEGLLGGAALGMHPWPGAETTRCSQPFPGPKLGIGEKPLNNGPSRSSGSAFNIGFLLRVIFRCFP